MGLSNDFYLNISISLGSIDVLGGYG